MRKITVQTIEKPDGDSVNDALQWLCNSLGVFSQRDKDNSCFRIFIELLKETKNDNALSSDELAARLNLVRGTVVHHLNKLIESGVVTVDSCRYYLRGGSLKGMVGEIETDANDILGQIKKVASKLDKSL